MTPNIDFRFIESDVVMEPITDDILLDWCTYALDNFECAEEFDAFLESLLQSARVERIRKNSDCSLKYHSQLRVN